MISIVIPVYNEQDSLAALHGEIEQVARLHDLEVEVVFVDDGSKDGTWNLIADLANRHGNVHGIRFRRNFGKAAALAAGFAQARGDIVVTMDGDLQDDPAEIPNFLKVLGEGYDVVSGWKKKRLDPWHKTMPSRVFNFMVSRLTRVRLHDHNCGMKCYRAEVLKEIRLYGELHRFIPVLAAARGFKVGELAIQHRPRQFGSSKYGVRRFFKGFLDLLTVKFLTGFGQRPQHFLGCFSLLAFLLGLAGMTYLGVTWIVRLWDPAAYPPVHERPLLVYSVTAFLFGALLLSIGFLAELIIANTSRDQDAFSVRERTLAREPSALIKHDLEQMKNEQRTNEQ
jgi:glycosyltransferase involved in cell wall biosynthesis